MSQLKPSRLMCELFFFFFFFFFFTDLGQAVWRRAAETHLGSDGTRLELNAQGSRLKKNKPNMYGGHLVHGNVKDRETYRFEDI